MLVAAVDVDAPSFISNGTVVVVSVSMVSVGFGVGFGFGSFLSDQII